jgi:hypothetical protein
MAKKTIVVNDTENKWCPIAKEICHSDKCAWLHEDVMGNILIKKCSIEAMTDSLHKIWNEML